MLYLNYVEGVAGRIARALLCRLSYSGRTGLEASEHEVEPFKSRKSAGPDDYDECGPSDSSCPRCISASSCIICAPLFIFDGSVFIFFYEAKTLPHSSLSFFVCDDYKLAAMLKFERISAICITPLQHLTQSSSRIKTLKHSRCSRLCFFFTVIVTLRFKDG